MAAVVSALLVALWLALAGIMLYLCALLLAAARSRAASPPTTPQRHRFRIVMPAHDEEQVLAPVLRHLALLDYPQECWQLVVVADNCTDQTAAVARAAGARVLERTDPTLRGKGHALAFAIDALRPESFDALVVLDADTLAEPNLLDILNRYLAAGHRVIQAYHDVLNPYESRRTVLMYVAFHIFHYVRPLGRRMLGLSTGLNGNGMCFAKSVVDHHPWNAFSLVEDMEYTSILLQHDESVIYAPEARIRAQMASGRTQATSQRMRWEGGRFQLAWRMGPNLLVEGLRRRNVDLVFWGVDVLVPPLAALVLLLLCGTVTAALTVMLGAPFSGTLLAAWATLGLVFVAFVLGSMTVGHLPKQAYGALFSAPWYVAWKIGLYVRIMLGRGPRQWIRTERRRIES